MTQKLQNVYTKLFLINKLRLNFRINVHVVFNELNVCNILAYSTRCKGDMNILLCIDMARFYVHIARFYLSTLMQIAI